MRKQLRQRNFFFAGLCELRPELRHASVDFDPVFLQHMEDTGAANSLRRRPDEDECVSFPGLLAAGIAKSVVKIDNGFSILPDRNRGSKISKFFEILSEQGLKLWRSSSVSNCIARLCSGRRAACNI